MAISISLSASAGSYNSSSKSTPVYVSIIASYNGGSFNRNASLTVTVGDSQQTYTVSVNGSESAESGSESIFSSTYTVSHTTTTTVYCHASLYAGGTTGTTTSSKSVTLTVPDSGSGDSGGSGEDEDDDIFDGGSTTPSAPYIIRIIPEEHAYIKVIQTATGRELEDNTSVSSGYDISIFFDVDDGYILNTHTINGTTIDSGESYNVYSNIVIRASAKINPINPALATKTYKNATASGLKDIYMSIIHNYTGEGGELSPTDKRSIKLTDYSISNTITVQWYYKKGTSAYSSENYSYNHAYAILFTTPDVENISSLKFKFIVNDVSTLQYDISYSLTTTDSDLTDYVYQDDDVHSISSGIISKSSLSSGSTLTFDIDSNKIQSNKEYYLVLYHTSRSTTDTNTATLRFSSVAVGYITGIYYIDNDTEYKAYQCHIYTTTQYDVYEMFRDNGTSWDLVQN